MKYMGKRKKKILSSDKANLRKLQYKDQTTAMSSLLRIESYAI